MRLIALALLAASPTAAQTVTTEADGSRTLTVEALVPAPPRAVWQSVSTAEGWKSWAVPAAWLTGDILETAYDPAARPGGPSNIQQRFLERVPGRSLVFRTIKTPAGFPHAQAFMGVTHFLLLLPEAGGTRVRLTDRGYPAGAEGDALLGFFRPGNQQTLDHLVARHGLFPLDFLVDHCWRGTLPQGGDDTHCFKAGNGKVIDRHNVIKDGKSVYSGDTVYAYQGGAIHFTYTSMDGGIEKGVVGATPDGLDFGTAEFTFAGDFKPEDVAAGRNRIHIATTWARVGDNAYDASSIVREKKTQDPAVRYTRID
jgi:uncharacterized protein YndB with AHSA1/START domain